MRRVQLIFQEVLKFIFVFLLSFIWLRYALRKLWLAFLLSALISSFIILIIYFINRKKKHKYGLKMKEKEEAEDMFFSLACSSNPIDFFAKLASKRHKNISKHKSYIVINYEELGVKTVLFADLSLDDLTKSRLMEIYSKIKKENATKIVVCCMKITDNQLDNFCKNFKEKFILLDEYSTYQRLYKFYDCFPEKTHKYNRGAKMGFKDFIAYSFNKKRTKGYLFSALILILSGLFVRTTIYYCIIASLLIVFAFISQFNPYYNQKSETEVL